MYFNEGQMAPYPMILQNEMYFSKLNMLKIQCKKKLRGTGSGIFYIIQVILTMC